MNKQSQEVFSRRWTNTAYMYLQSYVKCYTCHICYKRMYTVWNFSLCHNLIYIVLNCQEWPKKTDAPFWGGVEVSWSCTSLGHALLPKAVRFPPLLSRAAFVIHIYGNNSTEFVPCFSSKHCSLFHKLWKYTDALNRTAKTSAFIEDS